MTNALPQGASIQLNHAKEHVMLNRVLNNALDYYKDPKNLQAFEAWKKNKEELSNAKNNIDA